MNIVSIGQIVEMNNQLKEKNLPYQIHLRDACGGQSFFVEVFGTENDDQKHGLYNLIEEYFASHKMTVVYAEDKYHFTIKA